MIILIPGWTIARPTRDKDDHFELLLKNDNNLSVIDFSELMRQSPELCRTALVQFHILRTLKQLFGAGEIIKVQPLDPRESARYSKS
jgi:hypothetical protein